MRDVVAERWGICRALVNNAGNSHRTPLGELESATWHEYIDVNLNSVLYMTRAFLPLLEAAGGHGAALEQLHRRQT